MARSQQAQLKRASQRRRKAAAAEGGRRRRRPHLGRDSLQDLADVRVVVAVHFARRAVGQREAHGEERGLHCRGSGGPSFATPTGETTDR
jgi:hypothetical protein